MSWLKLTDSYDTHPKLLALTEAERWRWTTLLLSCARHESDVVTLAVLRRVSLHRAVDKLAALGLLEAQGDDAWRVHNFTAYNGATTDVRVASYLGTHPDASANAVVRVVGGRRVDVLDSIKRYHAGSTEPAQAVDNGAASVPGNRTKVVPGNPEGGSSRAPGTRQAPLEPSVSPSRSSGPRARARGAGRTDGMSDLSEEIEQWRREHGVDPADEGGTS